MTTAFLKTDVAAYTYDGTTLTKVTDADYPANTVPGVAYINGRIVVMEPDGTISHSDEDNFPAWDALNFVTAAFEPDGGVALARNAEYVVALGEYTTELYWDAQNPTGSILSVVPNSTLMIGCANGLSVQQVEDGLIWVAQQRGLGGSTMLARFVVVLKGTAYEKASTVDMNKVLTNSSMGNVSSGMVTIAGHEFYVLTLHDESLTLALDLKEGSWAQWTLGTAGTAISISTLTQSGGFATATATAHGLADGDPVTVSGANEAGYNLTVNITRVDANIFTYPVAAATATPATGTITAANWTYGVFDVVAACRVGDQQLLQRRVDGSVNYIDLSNLTDLGAPIDSLIRTPIFDGGTNKRKTQTDAELIGDLVSSTALIRWSDDDYRSFSAYRRLDLNVDRPKTTRGGRFKRRAYDIRHALPFAVSFTELEVDFD